MSYGNVQGGRGIEQLRLVLIELQMAPMRNALHLSNTRDKFDGNQFVGNQADIANLGQVLNDLVWWGNALKAARTDAP